MMLFGRSRSIGTHGRWMTALFLLTIGVQLGACSVGLSPCEESFVCRSNSDCCSNICEIPSGGETGVCGVGGGGEDDCADRDLDGFLSGEDCPGNSQLDCNDDPNDTQAPNINPGVSEICNGVDDNCDGQTDEDQEAIFCPLQNGVCAGTMTECVDGDYQDCITAGLYPDTFENVTNANETCDGLDNNCSGPAEDPDGENCECIPGVTEPRTCGSDAGVCERGVEFCQSDGDFGDCLLATPGAACGAGDTCSGVDSYCVTERVNFYEDFDDDCTTAVRCESTICRTLAQGDACAGDTCGADEVCQDGFCRTIAVGPSDEVCDGIDSNCDGRIDDDSDTCAPCPFGMVLIDDIPTAPAGLCVDQYEASRPDATDTDEGVNSRYAISRPGVLPWTDIELDDADDVCRGENINTLLAGAVPQRRLCQATELDPTCGDVYPYGDAYVAGSCNDASTGTDTEPTGSFVDCCIQIGDEEICDLAGNVAEWTQAPFSGSFGGSAQDSDADILSCDSSEVVAEGDDAFQDLTHVGFRCCAIPNL